MEFGRVTPEDLEKVDFTLPPDREETSAMLAKNKRKGVSTTKVYVGCAKWGRKDWVGKIYPKGTKESDFLLHYARHFNCIELNATFYRMPTAAQTAGWRNKVGDDFLFSPKFTDQISHVKRLKDAQALTDRFLEGISGFGNNLGPVFLMPHPGMGPKAIDTLEAYVQSIPKDIRLFTELRHKEWFDNEEAFKKVFDMFERNNVGAVITDASGRRDCAHMRLTTPAAFIRFVGNGLHPTDYSRVDIWVQRIKKWMAEGIGHVFFFMHQHEEIHSPELSRYVIRQLNLHCGTAISEPQFIPEGELFSEPKRKTGKKS